MKKAPFFKIVSFIVAVTFLSLQIGFAADNQIATQQPQQIQPGATLSNFATANQTAQDKIAQAQTTQQAQDNYSVNVTLANGTILKLNGADNNIISATVPDIGVVDGLKFENGTIKDGSLQIKDQEGTISSYNEKGQLVSRTDPQGKTTAYEYKDNGSVIVTYEGTTAAYDKDEKLVSITQANGTTTAYNGNYIGSIKEKDGTEYFYIKEVQSDGIYLNKLTYAVSKDGAKTYFKEDGLIDKVEYADGAVSQYAYDGSDKAAITTKKTITTQVPTTSFTDLTTLSNSSKPAQKDLSLKESSPYEIDFSVDSLFSGFKVAFEGTTEQVQYVTKTEPRRFWGIKVGKKKKTIAVVVNKTNLIEKTLTNLSSGKVYTLRLEEKAGLLSLYVYEKGSQKPLSAIDIGRYKAYGSKVSFSIQNGSAKLGKAIPQIITKSEDKITSSEQLVPDIKATLKDKIDALVFKHDRDGNILKYTNLNGEEFEYTPTGVNIKFPDKRLSDAAYSFDEKTKTTTVTRDGLVRRYDKQGQLEYAQLGDGTEVFYKEGLPLKINTKDNETKQLVIITKPDIDNKGKVSGGEFVYTDGSRRIYKDGIITYQCFPDKTNNSSKGTEAWYEKGKLTRVVRPDGGVRFYTYEKSPANEEVMVEENPVAGATSKFINGNLRYKKDKDGNIEEFFYGNDGKLITSIKTPVNGQKKTYGYAYQGDVTYATDTSTKTTLGYDKDGKLIQQSNQNGLTTEFVYDDSKSQITGGLIKDQDGGYTNTVSYEKDADTTIVKDETGTKRAYDKDGKLLYVETPNGIGYMQDYFDDKREGRIKEETLAYLRLSDGARLNYKDGKIDSIDFSDGRKAAGLKFSEDGKLLAVTVILSDGRIQIYEDGILAKEIRPGLGEFTFDGYGFAAFTDLSNIKTTYAYSIDSQGQLSFYDISKDINITYSKDGFLEQSVSSDGKVFEYKRDAEGKLLFITERIGSQVKTFDLKGRLVRDFNGQGLERTYSYADYDKGIVKETTTTYKSIGGYIPPVRLTLNADSHGFDDGDRAEIYVNDMLIKAPSSTWNSRGYNIAVIDETTGQLLEFRNFDTWNRSSEYPVPTNGDVHLIGRYTTKAIDNMIAFLNSIPQGRIVVVAVSDEGSDHMTRQAYNALASIGSAKATEKGAISDQYAGTRVVGFRDSWAIIGRKGLAPGGAIEGYSPRLQDPIAIASYSQSTKYIKVNEAASLDYKMLPQVEWQSRRPAKPTEVTEVLAYNKKGEASSWIKRLNLDYPESGFIRLWDGVGGFTSDEHMQAILNLSNSKAKKAVYFDPSYATSWAWEYSAQYYKNFLKEKGFEVLDAQGLKRFMEGENQNSIVVMAQDVFPDTVVDRTSKNPTVKDYLMRGGSIIWKQDTPFYYIGHKGGVKDQWGIEGQNKILGVGEGEINLKDAVAFVSPAIEDPGTAYRGERYLPPFALVQQNSFSSTNASMWGELKSYFKDTKPDADISSKIEYDAGENIVSVEKLDGTTTVYDKGRVSFVTDEKGNILTSYTYDKDGQLMSLTLHDSRKKIAQQTTRAKDEIAQGRVESLLELTAQAPVAKADAIARIDNEFETSIHTLRLNTDVQRSQLVGAINNLEGQRARGRDAKRQKSEALDSMHVQLDELNAREASALSDMYNQRASAYAQVDEQLKAEIAQMTLKIKSDEKIAFDTLADQTKKVENELLKQEITPVIFHWYRAVLGRDPDETELGAKLADAISKGFLDIEGFKKELTAQNEYLIKDAQKADIIRGVEGFLSNYLRSPHAPSTAGPDEQQKLLQKLGLASSELKNLTQNDVSSILTFLKNQNLHFGSSAFLALQRFIQDSLASSSPIYEELSTRALLIDILTGVITKSTKGELVISLYALNKTAISYGVTSYAAKLTVNELAHELQTHHSEVIAHINGNHYVTVTKVESGKVYYFEHNVGENGKERSLSLDEFNNVFGGYILSAQKPSDEKKLISDTQAKLVRGAFFQFLVPIIIAIFSTVVTVITTIVTAIAGIIASIAGGIALALKAAIIGIASAIQGIASGFAFVAKGLFAGINFVGASLFKGLGLLGTKLFSGGLFGATAAKGAGLLGFFSGIFNNTIVQGGLNFLISKGLRAIGLPAGVSSVAAAFITGAIIGVINPAAGAASILNSAITTGARFAVMQGIKELGAKVGLDGPLSSILSIAAGSLMGGGANFNKVFSQISGELAYYGVTKLGQTLGIDPHISQILGIPVQATITGITGDKTSKQIQDTVVDGLKRGVTSVVIEYVGQAAGIGPLATSLAANAVTGAIEGVLQGQNIFEGMANAISGSVNNLFNNQGDSSDPTKIAKVLELSQIIKERGLEAALTDYASAIFHRNTVESIWNKGGIADLISGDAEIVINEKKGIRVKRVYTNKEKTDYFDLSLDNNDIVAIKQGNVYENCKFVVGPDGKILLKDGTRYVTNPDGSTTVLTVSGFKLTYIENINSEGKTTSYVIREEGTDQILVDENNRVIQGKKIDLSRGYEISMRDGEIAQMASNFGSQLTQDEINLLMQKFNMAQEDLKDIRLIYRKNTDNTFSTTIESNGMSKFSQNMVGYFNKFNEFMGTSNYAPQVEVDSNTGVSKVDMPLEYYHLWGEFDESVMGAAEIYSLLLGRNAANEIWSKTTTAAAPFIVDQLASGNRFVYIPGINGAGPTLEELNSMNSIIGDSRQIAFAHSAGPEALLKAAVLAKQQGVDLSNTKFIFASPRMSPQVFEYYIKEAGLRPDQVLIVTAKGDIPNWPDASFSINDLLSNPLQPYQNIINIGKDMAKDSLNGYEGNKNWTSVSLETDRTARDNNEQEVLDHSSMINGLLQGHIYDVRINGELVKDTTLKEIYRNYPKLGDKK